MDLGPEEILLLVSRDPVKTAARLEEVKARKAAEARAKLAKDAARLLRSANARFRKAERSSDEDAERLRAEGEERLQDLAKIDRDAWPWSQWAWAARRDDVMVPPDGEAPVYEGLRVAVPHPITGEPEYAEFGRVHAGAIGVRSQGSQVWVQKSLDEVAAMKIAVEGMDVPVFEGLSREALEATIRRTLRYGGHWASLGWMWASDAWVREAWQLAGDVVVEMLSSSWSGSMELPVVKRGGLTKLPARHIRDERILAPTAAGWAEFVALVTDSKEPRQAMRAIGRQWWERRLPSMG
jgi:hypothetical protein